MEGEAEEALLSLRIDLARDVEEGRGENRAGREIEDLDAAALLDDEQAPGVARRRRDEDGLWRRHSPAGRSGRSRR
jgi:hypothetical protein